MNKILLDKYNLMKILKRKKLGLIEVYFVFIACILTGYVSYQAIVNSILG